MPKRLAILLLAAAIMVVGSLLFSLHRWREPSYQGISLNDWLPGYDAVGLSAQTDEAVRQMGAQSLPFLMEMFSATDSRAREALAEVAAELNVHHFQYIPAQLQQRWALAAFRSLGPIAKPAVPDLIHCLRSDETRRRAEIALAGIGSPSIAPLTEALGDSRPKVRAAAAVALGECMSPALPQPFRNAEESVAIASLAAKVWPVLFQCLKDPDPEVRASAATALGDFGVEPASSVQALSELLKDKDWRVRYSAAVALGRFREAALPAEPALTNTLEDPEATVRNGAAFALRMIDPDNADQLGAR